MKKEKLLRDINDNFMLIAIHLNLCKFVPRGLITHIVNSLGKINNFVLSELNVLLKLFVIQLEENKTK